MKKVLFVLFFALLSQTVNSASISLNYSPCSIYFGDNSTNENIIRLEDGNKSWGFTDKMSNFYFSKISLAVISEPERLNIPGTDSRYASGGLFFDVMHKELLLRAVDLKYLESGGRMHAVTYVLGYMYQWFFTQTKEGFNFGIGIGLAKTYLYEGNFTKKSSDSDNPSPVFRASAGYKFLIGDSKFLDIGIDMNSPAVTYHKINNGDYKRFMHGGIYPYIGMNF